MNKYNHGKAKDKYLSIIRVFENIFSAKPEAFK